MKSKIKQIFNLIFFVLITNTNFAQAHDFFNGGCMNHCKESVNPFNNEKKLNKIYDKNQIEDNFSCLKKSLCRG